MYLTSEQNRVDLSGHQPHTYRPPIIFSLYQDLTTILCPNFDVRFTDTFGVAQIKS